MNLQRNGPIVSYNVYYQQLPGQPRAPASSPCVTSACVMLVEAPITNATLPSLNKYVEYIVYVTASTMIGEGPASTSMSLLTSPDVPTGPVQNIGATATSSTSILLQWDPPAITLQNGPIQGYQIQWSRISSSFTNPGRLSSFAVPTSSLTVQSANITNAGTSYFEVKGLCAVLIVRMLIDVLHLFQIWKASFSTTSASWRTQALATVRSQS